MIVFLLVAATALLPNRLTLTAPVACEPHAAMQTSLGDPALLLRPQDRAAAVVRRLADLPKANLEYAVERSVDGCSRPAVIRYQAEGDGRFAGGRR